MRHKDNTVSVWEPFDYTIMIIKPHVVSAEEERILDQICMDNNIFFYRSITLTLSDIAYLYSTAYGRSFLREQVEYYSSGESEVYLINGNDIVNKQEDMKKCIREFLGATDPRKNYVHFPD